MVYNKLEPTEESKILVPSFRDEVGTRLRSVEKLFKNRLEAATSAGVAKSTYQTWVEGKVSPSFEGLAQLSKATGISLDWLATGEGPMRLGEQSEIALSPLDEKALSGAIRIVETWLALDGSTMKPDKKAVIIAKLYAYAIDEDEDKAADPQKMAQIFKLVANQ